MYFKYFIVQKMNDVCVYTFVCRHMSAVPSEAEGSIRSPADADTAGKSSGENAELQLLVFQKSGMCF